MSAHSIRHPESATAFAPTASRRRSGEAAPHPADCACVPCRVSKLAGPWTPCPARGDEGPCVDHAVPGCELDSDAVFETGTCAYCGGPSL